MSQKRKSLVVAQILFALVFAGVCLYFHAPLHEVLGDQGQQKILNKYHSGEAVINKWLQDENIVAVIIKAIPYLIAQIGFGILILLLRAGLYIVYGFHAIYGFEISAAAIGAGIPAAMPFLNPIPPAAFTGKVAAGMSIGEWLRRGRSARDLRFILIPAGSALLILAGVSGLIGNWQASRPKIRKYYVHESINDMTTNYRGDLNKMPVELNEVIIGPDTMTWTLTWHNKTNDNLYAYPKDWDIFCPNAVYEAFIEDDQRRIYRPIACTFDGQDDPGKPIPCNLLPSRPDPHGTFNWQIYFSAPQDGSSMLQLYYPAVKKNYWLGYKLDVASPHGWKRIFSMLRLK